jgi:hypothetical protein
MVATNHLLTDAQIQRFILDGYITVQTDAIPETHGKIHDQIETVFEKEGNVGNNILPRVPRIQEVFDQPVVRGALTSLLGPDYIMNPHRHCHLNPPGSRGQSWHKDCYVYDHNIRHSRFQWLLAFYYPQDTTADMGPSGVIPRKQNYKTLSNAGPESAVEPGYSICGDAGIVTLMHFDSWHRATPNVSNKKRYMLKFQFTRLREPRAPAWNHRNAAWTTPDDDANPAVSMDVWRWMRGQAVNGRSDAIGELKEEGLFAGDECVRVNAAYAFAKDKTSIPLLVDAMRKETLAAIEETTAKTADNAHGTNPTPGAAARALSTMGASAVPALLEVLKDNHWWIRAIAADVLARTGPEAHTAVSGLLEKIGDDHWWVRRNALEALRSIGADSEDVLPAVFRAVKDPDYRVRRNAALVLCNLGEAGDPAVTDLVDVLRDENRYNRFYAGLALRRIGTPRARNALLDSLMTARWCAVTTADDLY